MSIVELDDAHPYEGVDRSDLREELRESLLLLAFIFPPLLLVALYAM